MKRQYVIPDLLASLTADALFAGTPRHANATPATSNGSSALKRLGRWFKRAPEAAIDTAPDAMSRNTFTDDWAGGWYARTRLLQATTLAQHAANSGATTGQKAVLDASAVDAKAAS
jgi:hypothetical protein